MAYWQVPARVFGKLISPGFYSSQWTKLENKTATDVWRNIKTSMDKTYAQWHYVMIGAPGRDSVRRPYMFQSLLPLVMLPIVAYWITGRLFTKDPRQRRAAQIVAAAYGQGGQNVAAVPK